MTNQEKTSDQNFQKTKQKEVGTLTNNQQENDSNVSNNKSFENIKEKLTICESQNIEYKKLIDQLRSKNAQFISILQKSEKESAQDEVKSIIERDFELKWNRRCQDYEDNISELKTTFSDQINRLHKFYKEALETTKSAIFSSNKTHETTKKNQEMIKINEQKLYQDVSCQNCKYISANNTFGLISSDVLSNDKEKGICFYKQSSPQINHQLHQTGTIQCNNNVIFENQKPVLTTKENKILSQTEKPSNCLIFENNKEVIISSEKNNFTEKVKPSKSIEINDRNNNISHMILKNDDHKKDIPQTHFLKSSIIKNESIVHSNKFNQLNEKCEKINNSNLISNNVNISSIQPFIQESIVQNQINEPHRRTILVKLDGTVIETTKQNRSKTEQPALKNYSFGNCKILEQEFNIAKDYISIKNEKEESLKNDRNQDKENVQNQFDKNNERNPFQMSESIFFSQKSSPEKKLLESQKKDIEKKGKDDKIDQCQCKVCRKEKIANRKLPIEFSHPIFLYHHH